MTVVLTQTDEITRIPDAQMKVPGCRATVDTAVVNRGDTNRFTDGLLYVLNFISNEGIHYSDGGIDLNTGYTHKSAGYTDSGGNSSNGFFGDG